MAIFAVGPTLISAAASAAGQTGAAADAPEDYGIDGDITPAQKEALLNAAKLSPQPTGWEPLDTLVKNIFAQYLNDNMSTYQKVSKLFWFLMQGTSYINDNPTTDQAYMTIGRDITYEKAWDRNIVCEAYGLLVEKHGVCHHFASAFTVLARALGLEAYNITCTSFTLGQGDHYTSSIRLNGKLYIFDAVMGVALENRDEVATSSFFCTPFQHEHIVREYCNFDELIDAFGEFRTAARTDPYIPPQISGGALQELYFTLGSYPQTRVTDRELLAALNGRLTESAWRSYGYFSGNGSPGSQRRGDYMRYADVTYQNEKYRAVTFSSFRPAFTFYDFDPSIAKQSENGYVTGEVYWFKYEPIEWRLLADDQLLISNIVLDSQPFNSQVYYGDPKTINGNTYYTFKDAACTQPANDWGTSDIRQWLNGTFFQTAFSPNEQNLIAATSLENEGANGIFNFSATTDRVFLLSRNDVAYSDYYLSGNNDEARLTTASDYAFSQGISGFSLDKRITASQMLRSAGYHSGDVSVITNRGLRHCNVNVASTMTGIRPAIRLASLSAVTPDAVSQPGYVRMRAIDTGVIAVKTAVCNGATGYVFELRPQNGAAAQTKTVTTASPEVTFTDLTPGVSYTCYVTAVRNDGNGTGVEQTPATASPAVMCRTFVQAPTGLSGTSSATGAVTVSWDASSEPGAALFRVYRYQDSETLVLCGESSGSSCTVSGLFTGYNYWFKVSSVSADGYESDYSKETLKCACRSVPERPADVTVSPAATGAVTVKWKGSQDAAKYRVLQYGADKQYHEVGTTTTTSYRVAGLYVGTDYYFRIDAITADGLHVSTPGYGHGLCESFPRIPQNVSAASKTTGTITLSWTPVDGAGSYRIYRYVSATETKLIGTSQTAGFTDTDKGLYVGYPYTYRVTAVSQDGKDESAPSAVVRADCLSVPAPPTDVTVAPAATGAITVTWKGSQDAAKYRVLQYGADKQYHEVGTTTATSYRVAGLYVGSDYYFRVDAITADGLHVSTPAYGHGLCESVPAPPTDVTVTPAATGAVTVAWKGSQGAAKYRVLQYGADKQYHEIGATTATSYRVAGLNVGTKYYFRVDAMTADGQHISTPAYGNGLCESCPRTPQNVSAASKTTGTITLSWTPVDGAGSYRIYRFISATETKLIGTSQTAEFTDTDKGLYVGYPYTYRVTAVSRDGKDESTPSAAVKADCLSVPAAPTDVKVSPTATGVVTVTWKGSQDAAKYRILQCGADKQYHEIGTTAETSYRVAGLYAGIEYYFRIDAMTADGLHVSTPAYGHGLCKTVPGTPSEVPQKKTIQPAWVTLEPASITYDGNQKTPSVAVADGTGKLLQEGVDYSVTVPSGRVEAGNYEYLITGKGLFEGEVRITFTILPSPDQPSAKRKQGDVNGDGQISSADARLALRCSVGLEHYEETSDAFYASDADGDGKVTSADARLILRASVGLEDPANWRK